MTIIILYTRNFSILVNLKKNENIELFRYLFTKKNNLRLINNYQLIKKKLVSKFKIFYLL